MIVRQTIGKIRITFSIARIAKIMGVNSRLENGEHVLMWDFDKQVLRDVAFQLRAIQRRYALSEIHILETNKEEGNFIAYCFTRTQWRKAIEIVSATNGVDWNFIRISVYRGWFTLRVGAKKSGTPHIVKSLRGLRPPDCLPSDLNEWVEYETLERD